MAGEIRLQGKTVFRIGEGQEIPLFGALPFGVIDRGTNLLQVRPQSGCMLNCIFCSVDEGPRSKSRRTVYRVERRYPIRAVEDAVRLKGVSDVEIHIDATGEPLLYSEIARLVGELSEIEGVKVISMQTRGILLTEELIGELERAGLSRINLSIDTLSEKKAKIMAGTSSYNLNKALKAAEAISKSEIDLLIAPVWVPSINDEDMEKLITYAVSIGAGQKWPPLGIQKYEAHKKGRKVKGVRPMSWFHFYRKLREMERTYGVKLVLKRGDFGIHRTHNRVPIIFRKLQKVKAELVGPGWMRNEMLGVAKGRVITVVNCDRFEVGDKVRVRILENKDGIYLAEPI